MSSKPIIGFLGMGKLGTPLAVAIASKGYKILAYDVNPSLMKKQVWPHRETGLDGVSQDFQSYFDSADITYLPLKEVVQGSDILFICVQTPHGAQYEGVTRLPFSRADFGYQYLRQAAQLVAELTNPLQSVAVISTVLPGTMRREVLPYLPEAVYNPAFPAMGTAMRDFLEPEFILLGGTPGPSVTKLKDFYFHLLNRFCTVISIESAELSKCAYNTFVSMKVTVTNMLAEVAHKIPGCNIDEVSRVLTSATRRVCSPTYMQGGMGDGGACFIGLERVITNLGPKKIQDIEPGDMVLTQDGSYAPVLKRWERDYEGEIVAVKVRGMPEVHATPNHPFFVYTDEGALHRGLLNRGLAACVGKEVKKIPAEELTTSHFIPTPIPMLVEERPSYATDEYCELAGWYLSEGHIEASWSSLGNMTSGRLNFSLHEKEYPIAERLGQLCYALEPVPATGRRSSAKYVIKSTNASKGINSRYGCRDLCRHLLHDFGKLAKRKKIPSWVLHGDEETISLVLKGIFGGDGHCDKDGLSLTTISPCIAYGVVSMLERVGVASTMQRRASHIEGGSWKQTTYQVDIRNSIYLDKACSVVGKPNLKAKGRQYDLIPKVHGFRMRSVQKTRREQFVGKVYNLWVDHPSHSYVTAAGLVSNCHPRDNIAMSWLAEKLKLSSNLFDSVMQAREWQTEWLADLFCAHGKDMTKYLLGKAYKADSAIIAGSASVLLANILHERQIDFAHWDPYVDDDEGEGIPVKNPFAEEKACFFIGTQHSLFREYKFAPGSVILDPFRYITEQPGVKIIPIGIGR
jgi:UDP-glucose 6-dehydrogenase